MGSWSRHAIRRAGSPHECERLRRKRGFATFASRFIRAWGRGRDAELGVANREGCCATSQEFGLHGGLGQEVGFLLMALYSAPGHRVGAMPSHVKQRVQIKSLHCRAQK